MPSKMKIVQSLHVICPITELEKIGFTLHNGVCVPVHIVQY